SLLQQLHMSGLRVRVSPRCRLIGRRLGACISLSGFFNRSVKAACFIRRRLWLTSFASAWRFDELAYPFDKRWPVFGNTVTATVLSPGEFTTDQLTDWRHRVSQVVASSAKVSLSQQPVRRSCSHRSHKAAMHVHPFCVAFLNHSITDKTRTRSTHGN